MLHVEKGEVATGGLEDMADPRRGELDDEVTELHPLRLHHLPERFAQRRFLPDFIATSCS
jgi:hypothetical protein